jgi:acylphosphatase
VTEGTPLITRKALVSGRVQGVWYRASTAQRAMELGISGRARNLADGTVEVIARGEPAAVDALLAWLWQGPPLAQVAGVIIEELDPTLADDVDDGVFLTR